MLSALYMILGAAALLLYGWWNFHRDPAKDGWETGSPGAKALMSGVHGAFAYLVGAVLLVTGIVHFFKVLF